LTFDSQPFEVDGKEAASRQVAAMDYFKSAANAFLAKASPLPGYTIGERDNWFEGRTIWSLHQGICKEDSSTCSILVFDSTIPVNNPRRSSLALAKNALRKLRTTRHPDVVKLLDSAETPTAVYIAVESVVPLGKALEEMKAKQSQREEWVGWGLSKIASAVKFLNADAGSTHGTVRMESIFMSSSGEWRLGGFELTSSTQDESPTLYNFGNLIPESNRLAPPEVRQGGWGTLRDLEPHTLDSYMFALLIVEAYNGSLPPTISGVPAQGRVPAPIYQLVKRMMVPNAKSRLPTATLLSAGQAVGGFFAENRLFKVANGLDGFVLAREENRMEIMRQLKTSSDSFPPEFLQYKVLPALVNALAMATSNQNANTLSNTLQPNRILPLVLQLGVSLSDTEWIQSVAPPILKAYTSPDRGVRIFLLESLNLYAHRLEAKMVSDKIWPNLLTGFVDTAAAIREATIKAILPLSSKLSDRILNNDLLRQLARTQVDVEASIRTNTTILLGSLAPKLSLQTRKKVLVPAFSRSLKDPFVHARNAGLMALMATSESFDGDESAKLIIPAVAPCLVDPEKLVRDQAKSAMSIFMKKAQEMAAQMPETVESEDNGLHNLMSNQNGGAQSVIASTAGGAASALASWTLSQFTQATNTASMPSNSVMASAKVDDAPRRPSTTLSVESPSESSSNPPVWSQQGDLMDVMDDDDDWTGFETAPTRLTTTIKKKSLGAKVNKSTAATQRVPLEDVKTATMRQKMAMASLAGNVGAVDGNAWDKDLEGYLDTASPPATRETKITQIQAESALPSRSMSPASAFSKTPAWDKVNNGHETTSDQGANGNGVGETAEIALSKEDKRAEAERKREERRKRMTQLKESKAAKLASGLV
jgi:SCY1-like protein 1